MNKGCSRFIALLHFYVPPGKVPSPVQPLLYSQRYHSLPPPLRPMFSHIFVHLPALFLGEESQHSGRPAAPILWIFVTCWFQHTSWFSTIFKLLLLTSLLVFLNHIAGHLLFPTLNLVLRKVRKNMPRPHSWTSSSFPSTAVGLTLCVQLCILGRMNQ